MANAVIVNDGQTKWLADGEALREWLDANAEERRHPHGGSEFHFVYQALCDATPSVAGEGAEREITQDEDDSLPLLAECCGEWVMFGTLR